MQVKERSGLEMQDAARLHVVDCYEVDCERTRVIRKWQSNGNARGDVYWKKWKLVFYI